ncbi:MAG TPA: hypothetical protein VFA52_01050 [Candidatus Paceibacterota bacterium]|nr:hypothetical protein [Candidatus Paceibacterota bacterium]
MQTDIPRWFNLLWDFKKNGLFIQIHRPSIAFLDHYQDCTPLFRNVEDQFGFLPLFEKCECRLGEESFGINNAITLSETIGDWLSYRIKLPRFDYREQYSRSEIAKVCFTLQVLLFALERPPLKELGQKETQLFTLGTCATADRHGHATGGHASPALVKFIEQQSDSYEKPMAFEPGIRAMKKAYATIHGKVESFNRNQFRSFFRGGQVLFACPGDACELHTDYKGSIREMGDGYGTEIISHNLDGAHQQLTLLSGLGALTTVFDESKN